MPTLFCLKITGPGESILVITATIIRIGESTMMPHKEMMISMHLFIYFLYIVCYHIPSSNFFKAVIKDE